MALIQCKECGMQVSDLAQFCSNCGCPVCCGTDQQPAVQPAPQPMQQYAQSENPQMPCPAPAPVAAPTGDAVPAPGAKKSRKGGKIAIIVGICLGAAAILAGIAFLIRNLLDDSGSGAYAQPYTNYQTSTSAATEPATESVLEDVPLEGSWTSQFMDTVIFETVGGEQICRHHRYDYERSARVETNCAVRKISEDTITCIYEDGTLEDTFYTLSEDGSCLTLDGIVYQKTVSATDETLKQYIANGVPVFGNVYFGMTREEIAQYANFEYSFDGDDGVTVFYDLPDAIVPGQKDGFVSCRFNSQGQMETMQVHLRTDDVSAQTRKDWKQSIVAQLMKQYDEEASGTGTYDAERYNWYLDTVYVSYSDLEGLDKGNITLYIDWEK